MKRIMIIALFILATTATAFAMSSRPHGNAHILGSDDHQKKSQVQTYPEPNPPVSVPEPATMILLGSGLVALGAYRKFKR